MRADFLELCHDSLHFPRRELLDIGVLNTSEHCSRQLMYHMGITMKHGCIFPSGSKLVNLRNAIVLQKNLTTISLFFLSIETRQ